MVTFLYRRKIRKIRQVCIPVLKKHSLNFSQWGLKWEVENNLFFPNSIRLVYQIGASKDANLNNSSILHPGIPIGDVTIPSDGMSEIIEGENGEPAWRKIICDENNESTYQKDTVVMVTEDLIEELEFNSL